MSEHRRPIEHCASYFFFVFYILFCGMKSGHMRTAFTPHYSLQWLRSAGPRRQHSLAMVEIMEQKAVDPICSKTYLASESSGSNSLTGSQVSRDVSWRCLRWGGGLQVPSRGVCSGLKAEAV